MVEPPGYFRRAGILEVDDRVLVAVELIFIEERAGAVQQSSELELHVVANALAVKA
jgi:hypothetical protein